MKKTILSIALLLSVSATLLTSCLVSKDRRGHRDHGRHGGPRDSNHYENYHNRY